MRFLRQSLTGLFLASVMLALLIYAGQLVMGAVQSRMAEDNRPPQARERVFAVNLRTARMGTVTPVLPAFGQVESRRTLELRAAVGGRVIALAEGFEDGGSVTAGQLLAQLDPADAQSTLDRAKSDLLDAEAEQRDAARALILAQDELSAARDQEDLRNRAFLRQTGLQERGVGTAATVEVAELALAAARQAVLARRQVVAQSEARVDQGETRQARARIALADAARALADTTITASFDGTLSNVTVVEGRLVSSNEKLAELIDPDALEIAFRVSTAQYARLLDGAGDLIPAPVTATLDVSGAALVAFGRISRDSAATDAGQTGRMIYARLDSAPGFKPGDFVTVAVEEPPLEQVVRLPASALDGANTVLVLGAEDRLESLPVELVRRQGDDVLLRGAGLAGREVVIGRTPLLGAGIRVRPLREEAQAIPSEAAMLDLSDERRARLVALVEANTGMPKEMKVRVLAQLGGAQVPAQLVERIESRMGG
ncbi:efflux RND transporter periplasmic adaptor subunit [Antarcticimicrobium sediminis]|uniref:HlyD family efflux transporter periplasmic adaptor subunit n=1 Tax=Antarcticimicrobium sediminis TaxID=2546227 RepID=A0A4R5EYG4_9RHOB|nr:HlyD family efflux transporter periplasmic adaptor subunit [Antarcticimicrobium sediminis]TDE39870.1 HlyD family efflux transporter periplasmic adaptor subunit [Antarcticimicrobium sediminis]